MVEVIGYIVLVVTGAAILICVGFLAVHASLGEVRRGPPAPADGRSDYAPKAAGGGTALLGEQGEDEELTMTKKPLARSGRMTKQLKRAKRRTRLDISYVRQERACVALFRDGFAIWEIAVLIRWAEHSVHAVIRKHLR